MKNYVNRQFRRGEQLLTDKERSDAERVHETRLVLKRLRSVLRLFEDEAPKSLRVRLRSCSQRLAPFREWDVLKKQHRSEPRLPVPPPGTRLGARARRAALRQIHQEWPDLEKRFQLALAGRSDASKDWEKALRHSTRKVEKAMKKARRRARDEDFHAWRKRVKDLQYQQEALGARQHPTGDLKKLARFLGEAHDLALLEDHLREKNLLEPTHRDRLKRGKHDFEKHAIQQGRKML